MQLTPVSNFDYPAHSASWEAVRYWAGLSERFARATLACQVMAGFSLLELRSSYGTRQGKRSDLSTSPHNGAKLGFQKMLEKETGLSLETARRYMVMAKGVKKRWSKLPIRDRLHALMAVPPSAWGEDDAKLISDAVHKATDGLTQLEFMWELGIAKKPQGSGAKGRNPGEGGRPADTSTDAEADSDNDETLVQLRADMRLLSHPDEDTLRQCSTKFLTVHLQEVEAYRLVIAEILKRRKKLRARAEAVQAAN